jgi:hypothetical protein
MPDPLNDSATNEYFKKNKSRCQQALRDGSSEDRYKIMQAANHAKAEVLDGPLALQLMQDPDLIVRTAVHGAVSKNLPALTLSEIESWALDGDAAATSYALNFIRKNPKPEYATIVVKVLYQGWQLFNPMLFEAIIETKADGAKDLLRAYLTGEHVTLRTHAAIALTHLHDKAGMEALLPLLEKSKGVGDQIRGEYIKSAREMAERPQTDGAGD